MHQIRNNISISVFSFLRRLKVYVFPTLSSLSYRLSELWILPISNTSQCVKSVRIRSYCGLHFPAAGLNTDRYSVSLRTESKCGEIRTRITLNTDTFSAVSVSQVTLLLSFLLFKKYFKKYFIKN